jgi:hypothetical protein
MVAASQDEAQGAQQPGQKGHSEEHTSSTGRRPQTRALDTAACADIEPAKAIISAGDSNAKAQRSSAAASAPRVQGSPASLQPTAPIARSAFDVLRQVTCLSVHAWRETS